MTGITLAGCDPHVLISHMAMYGLAAILEAEGARDVRLEWTGTGSKVPLVSAADADAAHMAGLVQRHAAAHTTDDSWMQRDITMAGKPRGLMSPRLSQLAGQDWLDTQQKWLGLQTSRQATLRELTITHQWLDLRFLAALGEPCYWHHDDRDGRILQDDGASRFEMQPRNQGSEFVGSRLRKLAGSVAHRAPDAILAGLRGESVEDEIANNVPDSRTATGLAGLGPTDNALAWCALWGISQFPIAYRADGIAVTSGHLSARRKEGFYAPIWQGAWKPARLRSVLAAREVSVLAGKGLGESSSSDLEVPKARAWLKARGVEGIIWFPIERFGSDNAPERRSMRGQAISVGDVA